MQQRVASCPLQNIPLNIPVPRGNPKNSKNIPKSTKQIPENFHQVDDGSAEHGLEFHFDKDEQEAEEGSKYSLCRHYHHCSCR